MRHLETPLPADHDVENGDIIDRNGTPWIVLDVREASAVIVKKDQYDEKHKDDEVPSPSSAVAGVRWRVEFWCEHAIGDPKWMPYSDGEFEDEQEARQALKNAKDDQVRLVKVTEQVVGSRAT